MQLTGQTLLKHFMQLTGQTLLKHLSPEAQAILEAMAIHYSRAYRKDFALVARHNRKAFENKAYGSIRDYQTALTQEHKKQLQQRTGLNSRHVNSINIQLQGQIKSYLELLGNHVQDLGQY